MSAKVMGSESVRQSWRSVVDAVARGEDVVVQRHAKPTIAMIAYEDYAALIEELEDLRAARQASAIRDAIRSGKIDTIPWEKVKEELRAEGLLDD